jgi:hypothetical protein
MQDQDRPPQQPDEIILVFPATHPDGIRFVGAARERGQRVVAASSLWDASLATQLGELITLPYIHDPALPAQLAQLVGQRHITGIYAPVASVYAWLDHHIETSKLPLRLIGGSPVKREIGRFDDLMAKVANYRHFIDRCADNGRALADLEVAAVFRLAGSIYGESSDDKIAAMMAIFADAPVGDVVEIGSLAGKSAAVLALLARRYGTGNVLAIDPWLASAATQHDAPETVRVHLVEEWRFDMLAKDFVINVWPIGLGSLNYLRQDSAHACAAFRNEPSVISAEFGRVDYRGEIAVIHIDGNHDHAQVKLDCDLWLPLLAKDGWLILDDYVWVHGNGPRRVGDGLLTAREREIDRCFVCGKALFVKFQPSP